MSLYQNARPLTFEGVRGNNSVVKALRQYCRKKPKDRAHVLLFKGPAGCGKTTLAHIVAKEVGATDFSIFKKNAANTRGIDTIREMAANAVLLPACRDAVKVYIIDESHQLTKAAQEAMLEMLEYYPDHAYYFLCTTEPDNLIKAIRSRCTEFEVKPLTREHMTGLVVDTAKDIGFDISDDIVDAIVHLANGEPRSALVLLEKVSPLEDELDMLDLLVAGTEEDSNVIDLCKLLSMTPKVRKKRWIEAITLVNELTKSTESEGIRRAILGFFAYQFVACKDDEDAMDYAKLIIHFGKSTMYSGKAMLFALVFQACFELE